MKNALKRLRKLKKMRNKISVNLEDFKTILKKTRVSQRIGKKNYANEVVELSYTEGKFKVEIMEVQRIIEASGTDDWSVIMPLSKYQYIIKVKPNSDPLVIEYDDNLNKKNIIKFKLEDNKIFIFPSTLKFFFSENIATEPNLFIVFNYDLEDKI